MGRFIKPTVDELAAYATEIGFRGFDAERFLDHYEAVGWVVGKNRTPMKNWKAAVRLWRRNQMEWSGATKRDDPAVLDYAKQAKAFFQQSCLFGDEISRFWAKVRNAVGPAGVARVKELVGQK